MKEYTIGAVQGFIATTAFIGFALMYNGCWQASDVTDYVPVQSNDVGMDYLEPKEEKVPDNEYRNDGVAVLLDSLAVTRDGVMGTAVNKTDRVLGYVQISFNLYDKDGNQTGNAIDNINNLEPGGLWKFTAFSFGADFHTARLAEVTAF